MFSRIGTYPAVGMFSRAHIISILVCIALIVTALMFSKKMTSKQFFIVLKVFAIVLSIMEVFKIGWSIYCGYTDPDTVVPLYFCSLFIYALWLTCFKNQSLKDAGLSYIAFAAIVAGLVFIICPSTSFNAFPIFHFRCLHSMFFHSSMVYCGIMVFITKSVRINFKLVLKYIVFCMFFMTVALILNVLLDANYMFLGNPANVPLDALRDIYNYSQGLYTFVIVVSHIALGFVVYGICQLLELFGVKIIDDTEIVEDRK